MTIEVLPMMPPNQVSDPNIAVMEPPTILDANEILQRTPIQEFYYNANIFITGGTGFMGKMLIEKLLRSCQDVNCIYLLIRNKKNKNMHTRIEEIFDDPVFDRLKREHPKFRHKVQGIAGDCSLPNLGLSENDRVMLLAEITIVFHVAATVRFDEKLRLATAINVKSPRDMLQLCKDMTNLKTIIHVSTAYANCHLNRIDEKFYEPPMDSKKLITLVETMPENMLDKITPHILDKWPNTYAYTKAEAEDIVKQHGIDLPLGVFRPAIVISTYKEPIIGWIDNMYGPTGVCAAAGNGLMRTMHGDPKAVANIVPVDMCVSALIASALDVHKKHHLTLKLKKTKTENDVPIYNYVSSVENPIHWAEFMDLTAKYGINYPSSKAIWYYAFTLNPNKYIHWVYKVTLHYLPAALVDGLTLAFGKQPKLLKIYDKIHRFMYVVSYFSTRNWYFTNNNVQKLWQSLTPEDQTLFMFDMKKLHWDEYFRMYMRGIRIYLIKDSLDTLDEARKRWNRLYWIHTALKLLVGFLFIRFLWYILKTVMF